MLAKINWKNHLCVFVGLVFLECTCNVLSMNYFLKLLGGKTNEHHYKQFEKQRNLREIDLKRASSWIANGKNEQMLHTSVDLSKLFGISHNFSTNCLKFMSISFLKLFFVFCKSFDSFWHFSCFNQNEFVSC